MNQVFLHNNPDFKDLIDITASEQKIEDPSLVEKDYWIMHVLWSLQQCKLNFQLKGGTSLSKGYGCIHRFSEDIDLKIEPSENICEFKVYDGKNHDDKKHRDSRKNYFDWIQQYLSKRISGISEVKRDELFDDPVKFRNGGIRVLYDPLFSPAEGLKDGILLEVGFDRTAPNQPCTITSWAMEKARQSSGVTFIDNRALNVACYEPKYTFVEKLQAITRKFRLYKEGKVGANLPVNFIRHYYDVFQLLERDDVKNYLDTQDYRDYKRERFGSDDTNLKNSDAFSLKDINDHDVFTKAYTRSQSLYYRGRPSLDEILKRIEIYLDRM